MAASTLKATTWRVCFNYSGHYKVSEVDFLDADGNNITTGGSLVVAGREGSGWGGNSSGRVIDGDTNQSLGFVTSGEGPAYVMYTFPTPVAVNGVRVAASNDTDGSAISAGPKQMQIQYKNGSTWTNLIIIPCQPWTAPRQVQNLMYSTGDDGTVTPPPPPGDGKHRYWGVRALQWDNYYTGYAAFEWRDVNNARIASYGTPGLQGGVVQSGSLAEIFGGYDPSHNCQIDPQGTAPILYSDFGAGTEKQIYGLALYPNKDGAERTPNQFEIVYSDDAVKWTVVGFGAPGSVGTTYAVGTQVVFTLPDYSAPGRYWGLFNMTSGYSSGNVTIGELEFHETPGGADVTAPGMGVNAFSQYSTDERAAYAIDNDTTTDWAGISGLKDYYIVDLGAGVFKQIVEVVIVARNNGPLASQAPYKADVGFNSGGPCYRVKGLWQVPPYTTAQQRQSAIIGQYNPPTGDGDVIVYPPKIAGAHRYWALRVFYWGNNQYHGVSKIEFRTAIGGPNMAVGGVASVNRAIQDGDVNSVFTTTDNTSHEVQFGPVNTNIWDTRIAYDMGAGNAIEVVELALAPDRDVIGRSPAFFALECSDDGINWLAKSFSISDGWQTNTLKVFTIPTSVPASDRSWLLAGMLPQGGSGNARIADLTFNDLTTGAAISYAGTYSESTSGGDSTSNSLRDGNPATEWDSGNVGMAAAVWFDWGAGNKKTVGGITVTGPSNPALGPKAAYLAYGPQTSQSGAKATWAVLKNINFAQWTAANQVQNIDALAEDPPTVIRSGTHRYWMLKVRQWQSTDYQGLSKIEFRDTYGGPNVAVGGNATTNRPVQDGDVNSVFTTTDYTSAEVQYGPSDWNDTRIIYDMGNKGINVIEVLIATDRDVYSRGPNLAILLYSDDGDNWTEKAVFYPSPWTARGQYQVFTIPPEDTGRYWGLLDSYPQGGGSNTLSLVEMEIHDTLNGANLIAAGASGGMSNYSGGDVRNAWDRNIATGIGTQGGPWRDYIYADLGDGNTLHPIEIKVTAGGNVAQAPASGLLAYSTNRYVYKVAGKLVFPAFSGGGDTQSAHISGADVNNDIFMDWKVGAPNPVAADVQINWQILDTPAAIVKDIVIDWKVLGPPFADVGIDYSINGPFRADLLMNWQVRGIVNADLVLDYRFEAGVLGDITFNWQVGVETGVNADVTIDYKMLPTYVANFYAGLRMPPETGIVETWNYTTAIIASYDNTEQRAQLAEFPYNSVTYDFVILNEKDRREFRKDLNVITRGVCLVPMWQYATTIGQLSDGDMFMNFDPTQTDIRGGDYIYYLTPQALTGAFGQVLNLTPIGAILAGPVVMDLPKGSWVMPARVAYIEDGAKIAMQSISGKVSVTFDTLDTRDIRRQAVTAEQIGTFDGYMLVQARPLANNTVDEKYVGGNLLLDLAADIPTEVFYKYAMSAVGGARQFMITRGPALDYWREFAAKAKGQQVPFLVPTFRQDFAPLAFAGAVVRCEGLDYLDLAAYDAYSRVQIETDTGVQNFTIVNASQNGQNVDIQLSDAIDGTVIKRMSHLLKVRQASDEVKFTHDQLFVTVDISLQVINV